MSNLANFGFEIGTMRFIQRAWSRYGTTTYANLAEHTLRVLWTAVLIAKNESQNREIDLEKVMMMALIHDLGEIRTGDSDPLQNNYVSADEETAVHHTLADTGMEDLIDVWEEYEKRECFESWIVKDADHLDVDMEMLEKASQGYKYHQAWLDGRVTIRKQYLKTDTAKKMWDELQTTDPVEWAVSKFNKYPKLKTVNEE